MHPMGQDAPVNILLADDDKDDRYFFEKALKKVPITTNLTTFKDGEQLMDYLSQNSKPFPDVLVLDVNMPRKNGAECLLEIKLNPKLKSLPVIIYSTALRDEIADVFYKNGAHYYLQKCDFPDLVKSIQKGLTLLAENPNQLSRDKFILNLT
jgi:CheY-like chemotaxis protein